MENSVKQELERLKEHHFVEKAHMLRALQERFGDAVVEVAVAAVAADLRREWGEMGEMYGHNDAEELVHVIWEHTHKSAGFEFTTDKQADGIQIHCTKCPLADMARAIGEEAWGFRLYCGMDPVIAEAFNPKIGLRRTKTLMEGHDCCDHFYYNKK